MDEIVTLLKKISDFCSLGAVSDELIKAAENDLGITFSSDYNAYLSNYGVGTFADVELTGIVNSPRLNVVTVTKESRKSYSNFPKDMYVIHSTDFEGIDILQNSKGQIFQFDPSGQIKHIYNSLSEYVLSCIIQ